MLTKLTWNASQSMLYFMRIIKSSFLVMWYLGGVIVLLPGILFLIISHQLGLGND